MKHKKTCLEMGLVGEDVVEGAYTGNKKRGPRVLEGVWREWNESLNYGPRVEVLSLDEMDKMEADRERLIRYVIPLLLLSGSKLTSSLKLQTSEERPINQYWTETEIAF